MPTYSILLIAATATCPFTNKALPAQRQEPTVTPSSRKSPTKSSKPSTL